MRRATQAIGAMGVWLVAAACASTAAHPPETGDCVATDASCSVSAIGAGGSSGDGGMMTESCVVNSGDSLCTQCANQDCCPSLEACFSNANCQNLLNCTTGCAGGPACVAACEQQYPASVNALNTLDSCLSLKCEICQESGIGDPCLPLDNVCVAGLTCSGSWCTKPCTVTSDCQGIGAGGGNTLGRANACVHSPTSGNICFPGCATDSDCADFPDSYCYVTTSLDNLSVSVCTGSPDAGTSD